jgi:hypothetical protein
MKKLLCLLAASLLSSCASTPSQEQVDASLQKKVVPAMEAYIDCVKVTTERLISAKASPYQIADASTASCTSQRASFEKAHSDHTMETTSSFTQYDAFLMAEKEGAELQRDSKAWAVKRVVESRTPSSK